MSTTERDRFRYFIGNSLGIAPNRVTLFARGRVAFYAILRALRSARGTLALYRDVAPVVETS